MTEVVTVGVGVCRVASDYLRNVEALLRRVDLDALERTVEILRQARDHKATIYVAGNGGSAATASHLANDLGKATKAPGRPPMRVLSLSDNTSWLTALGNDEGFDRVFSGQLENFAEPDDVLIVISASGNSPNLVRAAEIARSRRLRIVALLGFDGGVLKEMVDESLVAWTAKGAYGPVESIHSVLCHVLIACLNCADDMAAARSVE
ncbi:MAG: SIS domain-containing protein [Acidobacteria bacterium]|nr:MAG: SIS domain-containing protein [Acidobacteriota bacterium]